MSSVIASGYLNHVENDTGNKQIQCGSQSSLGAERVAQLCRWIESTVTKHTKLIASLALSWFAEEKG
ncbi:hypothetical protein [Pseudoalteromonas rubra]|uniref:hypothetical protein n=1 Tax=Pseudoalteromonas rubra TaxID=43658 RepID=UPI00102890BC|nr:hypothetical protein [Pseudoalteromonas rubra]